MKSHARPSYAQGLATPERGGLLYPALWNGVVFAACPSLGATGLTLRDHSGRGNHGAITEATEAEAWADPAGLTFGGTDDYVAVPHTTDHNWGSGDGTIAAWVNFTADQNAFTCFAVKGAGGLSQKRYQLVTESDGTTPRFDIDDDGGALKTVGHNASINDGTWHLLIGVRDGNNLRLYVDGVETSASPTDITGYGDIDDTEGFTIGASNTTGSQGDEQYYDGTIDDTTIWNRALPSNEIAQLYRLGPGGMYRRKRRVIASNPIAAPAAGRINSLIGVGGGMIGYGGGMIGRGY